MESSEKDARLTIEQVAMYEIAASWWAGWVGNIWLQSLAGRYFAWKARRKWRRYISTTRVLRNEE